MKQKPENWERLSALLGDLRQGMITQAVNDCDMLLEYLEFKFAKGDSAGNFMGKGVINTLPHDVVLPDQLTPTRSMIQSGQNSVPTDLGKGVNFITSDHTSIALYVAGQYVEIPPPLADYVTARIVYDRRTFQNWKNSLCLSPTTETIHNRLLI